MQEPTKVDGNQFLANLQAKREAAGTEKCPEHPQYCQGSCDPCADAEREASRDNSVLDGWAERVAAECDRRFPLRFRKAVADHREVLNWVDKMHDDPTEADSLILFGLTGRGKTWQAYGAMRAALIHPRTTTWAAMTAADLVASMRPRDGVDTESQLAKYREVGLLLIDDIGVLKNSEWVEEITYRLINGRYERMKPTIFTSNLGPEEIKIELGSRVSSRLAEMCQRVILEGEDRRLQVPSPRAAES